MPEPVGDVADDHPADRQHPPVTATASVRKTSGMPSSEAEEEAEVDDEAQLPARRPRGRCGWRARAAPRSWRITISLTSSSWSMCAPISSVTARTMSGSCSWTRACTASRTRGGSVAPQLRVLALHDPLDEVADVAARGREDVLGDLVRLELLVEVRGAAELGDPLVDRDRAHLRRARGNDPLPADAALHHPGDLLDLARQQADERRQAGNPEAGEADGIEQHPDAAPVGQVADRAGEERDRDRLHQCRCP